MSILEEKKIEIENLQSQIELTPRMKNLTNKKQGHITFLKISHKKDNRNYWWTICDCGTIEQTRADSKKEHCIACARKQAGFTNRGNQAEDLTNKRFGKLTVLYSLEERKNGHIIWHCKCDCGKERDVVAGSLKSGNTKSCGCLRKETNYFTQYKINLVNQRFGYLTVLEETEERQYEKVVWKCQCDCGNIVFLNTSRLKNGNDTSCGCKKQSLGMLTIKKLLEDNNIQFKYSGGADVTLSKSSTSTAGYFRPTNKPEDAESNLGSATYKWNTVYATNTSIQSDRKDKREINEIEKAKEFIMALEPVQYKFKNSSTKQGRTHFGFIAQDVAEITKTLGKNLSLVKASHVIENKDGSLEDGYYNGSEDIPDEKLAWSLDYNEFIAPLVAVVQEQQKRIEELEKKLSKL